MINCRPSRNHITSSKAGIRPPKRMPPTIIPSAPPWPLTTDPTTTLLEVVRDRLLYPDLKAQAISQAKKHRPNIILIEEAGIGRALIKDLKAAGLPAVGVIPEGDKLTRVSLQLEKFTNGQVFFPKEAPWLVDLENELFAFPNGRYDDQVDAIVQALAHKPTPLWNDAALKGFEKLANSLWLQNMRGF